MEDKHWSGNNREDDERHHNLSLNRHHSRAHSPQQHSRRSRSRSRSIRNEQRKRKRVMEGRRRRRRHRSRSSGSREEEEEDEEPSPPISRRSRRGHRDRGGSRSGSPYERRRRDNTTTSTNNRRRQQRCSRSRYNSSRSSHNNRRRRRRRRNNFCDRSSDLSLSSDSSVAYHRRMDSSCSRRTTRRSRRWKGSPRGRTSDHHHHRYEDSQGSSNNNNNKRNRYKSQSRRRNNNNRHRRRHRYRSSSSSSGASRSPPSPSPSFYEKKVRRGGGRSRRRGGHRKRDREDHRRGSRVEGNMRDHSMERHSYSHRHHHKAVVSEEGSSGAARNDSVGHFEGGPGVTIADRYEIVKDVGMGTFGRVVECIDRKSKSKRKTVAIKIVRNVRRYYDSALIEADIVDDVNSRGGRGLSLCAQMLHRFDLNGHYCLVFECLGRSLYDFLKKNDFQPFPLHCVQHFACQLLDALDFLHSFRLIHTDLKPENILLVSNEETTFRARDGTIHRVPASTQIKVIDFGGSTYDYEKKSSVINTRQYRAPEVILELGWSTPSDLWSAGCIIAELYKGELLFATHDNTEHLALIEQSIGPFPRAAMLDRSHMARDIFDKKGRHRMEKVLEPANVDHVRHMGKLESVVNDEDEGYSGLRRLLKGLLVIDPKKRLTAREALRYAT